MKIYKKFQTLSRGRQIGCVVVLVHFLCIFGLIINHWIVKHPPKRPIAVRTRQVTPVIAANTTPAPKQRAAPKPSAPVVPKQPRKTPPAKAPKKVTAASPSKATPAKKAPKEVPKIVEEPIVEEVVTTTFTPSVFTLPALIETPAAIENPTLDPTYEELLIATFQSTLDLPEIGEVKARLEIDRSGRLVSCVILETKSRKNGEFLKNRLPDLVFPCFNGSDIQSFTVTFRNVENR